MAQTVKNLPAMQETRLLSLSQKHSLEKGIVSVPFSCSGVSNSSHARLPCPSLTPRVYSNSSPSSRWCHPTISSSVIPFFFCPQSLPASECFPMSQLFTWSGQSTGVGCHGLTHVHWVDDAIQPSHPVIPFFFCPQSFPASGSFQISQFFLSGGQSIRASASASVLPVNIQDWFPLGGTGWISLQSKGLSRIFSNTTVQKHQFCGAQLSL